MGAVDAPLSGAGNKGSEGEPHKEASGAGSRVHCSPYGPCLQGSANQGQEHWESLKGLCDGPVLGPTSSGPSPSPVHTTRLLQAACPHKPHTQRHGPHDRQQDREKAMLFQGRTAGLCQRLDSNPGALRPWFGAVARPLPFSWDPQMTSWPLQKSPNEVPLAEGRRPDHLASLDFPALSHQTRRLPSGPFKTAPPPGFAHAVTKTWAALPTQFCSWLIPILTFTQAATGTLSG